MEFLEILGYLLTGSVAGTLAGLFGVGGGLIIVPALVFAFPLQGINPEVVTHLAVGTSLATIVPTSVSSTLSHHRNKAVVWSIFPMLMAGIVLGAWLGVMTAISISGGALQVLIGTGAILIGLRMLLVKTQESSAPHGDFNQKLLGSGGVLIGYASSIFGIGGGTMTVPFLSKLGVRMQHAVGTSAACGLPIAVTGALANVILGSDIEGLPAYSTGLVYWPAFLGIVLMSVPFARVGAKLAHSLPALTLKRLFACLLFAVGLNFILGS
ncbi:sulfite exporter TauE/SafE family protein [Sansalvadorimonas sp. 2012CJ34-2]|uniref:Probable membrane transporter protein n=1 Tax=Parendozoicomonas callyspongiae TaxID=2942213 RepID=A0ABT0PGA7_9GAMM|nr:sulfite exporter TauE/SafE family protein [Sansalvadorimonas sp. 2012CJ34-2]MCL6270389.1 sulfite exporter TauE/SafE family protein [Sansalvadorimonas sp. 2012CJ34-2]